MLPRKTRYRARQLYHLGRSDTAVPREEFSQSWQQGISDARDAIANGSELFFVYYTNTKRRKNTLTVPGGFLYREKEGGRNGGEREGRNGGRKERESERKRGNWVSRKGKERKWKKEGR